MKRTALFFAALTLTACDSSPEDAAEARLAELDAEDVEHPADLQAAPGTNHEGRRHRSRKGRHDPASTICEQVACSDAQLEQVQAVFVRGERPQRGARPDMSAANATLARAFAGSSFAESDLVSWKSQMPGRSERDDHRLDAMSELHTILDAQQRHTLATKIAAGEVFGGRHGQRHASRRRAEQDEGDERHTEHLARRVERFCEPLSCADAQRTQLTEILERGRAARPGRGDESSRRAKLARAFEADAFDAAAVAEQMLAEPGSKGALLVEVHGVLTPEQRATLAQRIAEDGPRAVLGNHGREPGHRGKRHRRGHGKHRGGPGGDERPEDGAREFG